MKTKVLHSAPSIYRLYARALYSMAKLQQDAQTINAQCVKLNHVSVVPKHLNDYRKLCGFNKSDKLPITYPHILAFPLHMSLLVDDAFPYPLLGLVHVRNVIIQHRNILPSEILNVSCQIDRQKETPKGIEFDIKTFIYINDELVWEGISTMLYRKQDKGSDKQVKVKNNQSIRRYSNLAMWLSPSTIGREYAKISGDRNPIHLYTVLAKLFGFRKHIAHGMWSKARCLAQLEDMLEEHYSRVSVQFKRPVFLPSSVQMSHQQYEENIAFELSDLKNENQHITGEICFNENS